MNTHATALPQHTLSPEPETPTPSIIMPLLGTIPTAYSAKRLKSAIASFSGAPSMALKPYWSPAYNQTFHAMYDDLEVARSIVREDDRSRMKNLGDLPSDNGGIEVSYQNWRTSYGPVLAFTDFPLLRTTALLLRGDDAGRLRSFTIFSLRALSARLTGRTDGMETEVLLPNRYLAVVYTLDGHGNLEPNFLADPEASPREDYLMTATIVVWLLDGDRRKSQIAG